MAGVGGVPYVAWSAVVAAARIRVARLEPDFLSAKASPSKTGALLSARLRTYGIPFPIGFEFGTALGRRTAAKRVAAGSGVVTVTRRVGGLKPGTRYRFRPFAVAGVPAPLALGPIGFFSPDATPPRLRAVHVKPDRFVAGAGGGTAFTYRLSEPARVVFKIERKTSPGHFKRAGRFARRSPKGRSTTPFSGRIGKRNLSPGDYRATLVATDAAGNRSKRRRVSFEVASGPR
jgi:hypothetical protein